MQDKYKQLKAGSYSCKVSSVPRRTEYFCHGGNLQVQHAWSGIAQPREACQGESGGTAPRGGQGGAVAQGAQPGDDAVQVGLLRACAPMPVLTLPPTATTLTSSPAQRSRNSNVTHSYTIKRWLVLHAVLTAILSMRHAASAGSRECTEGPKAMQVKGQRTACRERPTSQQPA